jgi:hypothetical protein
MHCMKLCVLTLPPKKIPIVFVRGWLAHRKRHKFNWPQYAYDIAQEHMKRM